jgi:uncharacterized protein (TIRG00374 family)
MKRWLIWLLIIAFIWIVVSRFAEIEKLVETLVTGQWQWVLAAALLQVFYYIIFTGLYQSAFETVGVQARVWDLLPVMFTSLFMNVAAPSGGASGAALFVNDVARRGQSAARAAAGTLLVLIVNLVAFSLVLVVGIGYLYIQNYLTFYEVAGATFLMMAMVVMTVPLALSLWRPNSLRWLLARCERLLNGVAYRFKRQGFLEEGWNEKIAGELSDAATAIATSPHSLARTIGIALAAHLVDLFSLYVLFLAFHQVVLPGTLIAGYAMGILFWIVSITPQGIGVVEGVMAVVFTSLGVPAESAMVVSLAFRGLTFWLPLLLGFLLLRRVRAFENGSDDDTDDPGVHIIAVFTALMGIYYLLAAAIPSVVDILRPLEAYMPLQVSGGSRLTDILAGIALLYLSQGLWRHKRVAWLLTLIVLLDSIANHLIKGQSYERAVLAGGLAAWLIYLRRHFRIRLSQPSTQAEKEAHRWRWFLRWPLG